MTFREKLFELTKGQNKSELARRAGLTPTAITDYLSKGYLPRVDKALALARALEVPFEWLYDDSTMLPAPTVEVLSPSRLSDYDLMLEVARRYRALQLDLHRATKDAEAIDWARAAREAASVPPTGNLPPYAAKASAVLNDVEVKFARVRNDFDLGVFCVLNHERLPGSEMPPNFFESLTVSDRFIHIDQGPQVLEFIRAMQGRPELDQARKVNRAVRDQQQEYSRLLAQDDANQPINVSGTFTNETIKATIHSNVTPPKKSAANKPRRA